MHQGPHSSLPTAQQIRLAIDRWFRGGGTATLIVNVCRREMTSLAEAEELAHRLAERANNGWNHFTDEFVSEQLEIVRAVGAILQSKEEQEAKSPHPPIGSPEWHRRATERALRNKEFESPYANWKWEKPTKQLSGRNEV